MTPESLLRAEPVGAAESGSLLRHWRWLVPEGLRLLCVTQIGDAFLEAPDGPIWWLNAGSAQIEPVARDREDWLSRLQSPEVVESWSAQNLIDRLEAQGSRAGAGQCFTYLQCPLLGGSYEPSNFEVVSLQRHFDLWGPIHERLRGLPDGTSVQFEVTD